MRPNLETKMRGNDRVLELKIIDGTLPKRSTGLVDSSIFKGDNKLHAIFDDQTQLWYLKYDRGIVPPALKQSFTSYSALIRFVKPYFEKRNIEIIDA